LREAGYGRIREPLVGTVCVEQAAPAGLACERRPPCSEKRQCRK